MGVIILFFLFVVGIIFSFGLPEKAAGRGLRKIQESNLSEGEKAKRIAAVMSSVKLVKFGVTAGVIICPLFLFVQSAENWGLARYQKIIFYGFSTILFVVLNCYGIYHIAGKIFGKKKLGIFVSVFFGIIMLFFVYHGIIYYWIIRITGR